ncbi:MAG TPA: efflux RND transporter periplasmic adaptor subunit [Gemmatimonadaceae bacterium]|nr:efflux RND transporter periplasmic adaptor subunit [Gemmatimonadaceae bacterium]
MKRAGGATLLVLSLVSLAACRGGEDASAAQTPPVVTVGLESIAIVDSARITTGPSISGSLQAERTATVRAEVGGPVLQTYAEQGQRVSRGTLLARIDDAALREDVISARAALQSAEQAATVAQRNEERTATLVQAGALAERDLETARTTSASADAQVAAARARLQLAQDQLSKTTVRAPFDGVVSERQVSGGDVVQPGAALYTVIDPSTMRLEASVPAEQLGAVHLRDTVAFDVNGYPDRTFTGTITRVSPAADPTTRQVQLIISIPNRGDVPLVAGLFADGRVASTTHVGLIAPANAVDLRGLRPTVTRLRDGKAQRTEVQLGIQNDADEMVEITAGVARGDTLLLGAAEGISTGTPVRVAPIADRPAAQSDTPRTN